MMQQSDGLQPSPQEFLDDYASDVESKIRKLQTYRQPSIGEQALKGAEDMTASSNLAGRI
jgi:hypothetical protein